MRPNFTNWNVSVLLYGTLDVLAHLLLLHQFRIGAVVHHVLPEDRCGEGAVYFLRVEILVLPIEDEIVPLDPQTHRRLLPEQDECENIAIL